MDKGRVIVIRCFETCTYRLAYPAFFLEAKKSTVRKMLKWLYQFDWQNREAIEVVEQEFPNLVDTVDAQNQERVTKLAQRLQECTENYERDFLDPDPAAFPPDMTKDEIRSERQARKDWNDIRKQRVKNAKSNLEQAKKDAKKAHERAKEVYELFLSEKR